MSRKISTSAAHKPGDAAGPVAVSTDTGSESLLTQKLLPRPASVKLAESNQDTRSRRLPHIAGLDGIRAIAVATVVLYHLGISWMPGGFLGVEVFFVLSGYLITALLLGEHDETSTISLKRFWLRRARRLLPALAAVLIAVTVFVAVAFRDELDELWGQLAAAATYITNWQLIFQDQSYFAGFGRPEVLQHLWSLAVEEQFYLFWPVLFFVGMKLLKRTWFTVAVAAGVAASTAWMWLLFEPLRDPSRIYYGTDTRAAGLLLGALLALLWRPWRWMNEAEAPAKNLRLAANIVGPLALAGVVWWCVYLTELDEALFKGGFLWLAATTALLIAAVAVPNSWFSRAMDNPVLRWVGVRSYAIYLWHWPVLVFTRPGFDVSITGWELHVLRVGATLLLSDLSYRFVEHPIRTRQLRPIFSRWIGQIRHSWRGYLTPLGALASIAVATAVIIVPQVSHTTPALDGDNFILEAPVEAVQLVSEEVGRDDLQEAEQLTTEATAPSANPQAATPASANPETATPASANPETTPTPASANPQTTTPPAGANPQTTDTPTSTTPQTTTPPNGTTPQTTTPPNSANPQTTTPPLDQNPTPASPPTSLGGLPIFPSERPAPANATTDTVADPIFQATLPGSSNNPAPFAPPPGDWGDIQPRITAFGDSVMLGASAFLRREFADQIIVDAEVSRQFLNLPEIIRQYRQNPLNPPLGEIVVIHLGTNGNLNSKVFDKTMEQLSDIDRVLFVNVRVPKAWESEVNKQLAAGVERWENAFLVDWHGYSDGNQEEWLNTRDGVHMVPEGARAYTRLLRVSL